LADGEQDGAGEDEERAEGVARAEGLPEAGRGAEDEKRLAAEDRQIAR
jgi:hypothetical protein